jgi:glycosyltransferase involved in cell wall biosynthesis
VRALRFCMLTTFYPPWSFGGDANYVQRLAHALVERGHEVTVVHSLEAYQALAPGREMPEGRDLRLRVISVDAGWQKLSPLATYLTGRPLLTRRTLAKVLSSEFDVLHFHNPSLLGGPALLQMGSAVKLYTLHEQWLVCPTHVLWKYQRRVCEKPTCIRCALSYRRPPQLWRHTDLLQRSLAHVDALIAPSRTTARLHQRFASIVRIEHIPYFLAEPPVEKASDEFSKRPYFLFVGRLEAIKGLDVLVEAFRRRRSEDLLVAGTGSRERLLHRAAADLPHVRFLGRIPSDRLGPLYRGALALIVPTLGHESFPLVLLESFARGTGAIVHRMGALAEMAEETGAALTYETDDGLLKALDAVASSPTLRQDLGHRARSAYLRSWTPEVHLTRYFQLIADVAYGRGDQELARLALNEGRNQK